MACCCAQSFLPASTTSNESLASISKPAHLARLLRASGDEGCIAQGRKIHARIAALGLDEELGNHLLRLYLKCRSLADVEQVFSRLEVRDVASWTSIITAYAEFGHIQRAILMFRTMQLDGVRSDKVTFLAMLKAFSKLGDLVQGQNLHNWIVESGLEDDPVLANLLLNMYGSCGCSSSAMRVFCRMRKVDVVSWNAVITVNARNGQQCEALKLFREMQLEGVKPDKISFVSTLNACSSVEQGREIHASVRESGFEEHTVVGTALASMYGRLGEVEQAREVFDWTAERDVVSWNAMLGAYAQHGYSVEAVDMFRRLLHEGVSPSKVTLVNASTACSELILAKMVHACSKEMGLEGDLVLGNALLDMYTRCGGLREAERLFQESGIESNVVSWNTMIVGNSGKGRIGRALTLFRRLQLDGLAPVRGTYLSMLEAVANNPEALSEGKRLHLRIVSCGFSSDPAIGNAVVKMYGSCGRMEEATAAFEELENKQDVVSWNAIISTLSQHDHGRHALRLFRRMDIEGVIPSKVTCISVLDACASVAALTEGKIVHDHVRESGLESNIYVATSLASMYGRCGNLEAASELFKKVANRDVVIFNAMLAAYSQNGLGDDALKLFWRMQQEGSRPDEQSFVSVLSACSHAGLADEGWDIFLSMKRSYDIDPSQDHYACAVDVLGRAGWLRDAEELIRNMHVEATVLVWKTLLGACRKHGDVDRGKVANEMVRELEPRDESAYVMMSNIFAGAGMFEDAAKVREEMDFRGLRKEAGKSWIEIKNKLHEFVAGDKSHPRSKEIYRELERLHGEIRKLGYVPDTKLVLKKVGESEKERMLCQHSERLAIAFGVVTSPLSSSSLRVMKNLRVCDDCHNATKLMSRVVGREIVVRDTHRFHHFVEGLCSCGDYW